VVTPQTTRIYDIHENNHIGLTRRNVVYQPHLQPSDDAMLTLRVVRPLEKHPDGMSGDSAFVIRLEHGKPQAYFAGIIVRGGRDFFTILKAGVVCAFLDSVFR
jgi:hypothetical protein